MSLSPPAPASTVGSASTSPAGASTASASRLDEEPYVNVTASATGKKQVNWSNHPQISDANGIAATTTPFSIKAQLAQMLKGGVIMGQKQNGAGEEKNREVRRGRH